MRSFCSAKAFLIFSTKNVSFFCYKVVEHLTSWPFNELVKLTMLWTTGPRLSLSFSLFSATQEWVNEPYNIQSTYHSSAAFLNPKFPFIHSLKWHHKPFSMCKAKQNWWQMTRKKVELFRLTEKIRKFTFFGKYKKYFISCWKKISNFTLAVHLFNLWHFQHIRWNIFGFHLKKVNIPTKRAEQS